MSLARRDFFKLAGAGAAGLSLARKAPAQGGKFPSKVVILGFDGASPHYVEQWMNDGLLPNLAKLRGTGTYARISTANPPQTPVSWAAFATGMNPGKTKLFDFLRRNPMTYEPEFALVDEGMNRFLAGSQNPLAAAAGGFVAGGIAGLAVKAVYNLIRRRMTPEAVTKLFDARTLAAAGCLGALAGGGGAAFASKYVPDRMPYVNNAVQGQTFWQVLDEESIPTLSFRVPARFPADRLKNGRALAGLGVPDARGTVGYYTYYTTELLASGEAGKSEMGGTVVPLYFKPTTNETTTVVYGPYNKLFPPDDPKIPAKELNIPIKLKDNNATSLTIETPEWKGTLEPGQWSQHVPFTFKYNDLVKFEGYARFYLLEMTPDVKLFLQPINFHPKTFIVTHGPVRISTPPSFAGELYDKYGPYKTIGWAAETNALKELRITEEIFLEDLYDYVGQYRQMMNDFLKSPDKLFVDVYSFTDRIGHMFWHHLDPKHPMYTEANAEKYGKVLLQAYQTMDSIVGDVMKSLDSSGWLFVLSDHGFQSFANGFNINTWLAEQGLLVSTLGTGPAARKMKLEDLFGEGLVWENVDWSRTKAYGLGLGGVYVNLKDREGQGVVSPGAEYEAVRSHIVDGLGSYVNADNGEKPVFQVYKREDLYTGYDPGDMPDLRVANAPGYRCSWQSSLGGIEPTVISPNLSKWSGDHCTYEPSITKGIFFCNNKLSGANPHLMDFHPTVLDLFGFKANGDIDGKSLL